MLKSIIGMITLPDKILIGILLILAISSVLLLRANSQPQELDIFVDNELWGSYSLWEDKEIEIEDGITVEIREGRVRMKESTCRNQICVNQGFSKSLPVICAPRKIALMIRHRQALDIMITR